MKVEIYSSLFDEYQITLSVLLLFFLALCLKHNKIRI